MTYFWIIAAALIFLIIAVRRLDWAVLIIIAGLPSYLVRFRLFGLPLTFLETMILLAFAAWFLRAFLPDWRNIIKRRADRQKYPYAWEIILVIILSFIAAGISGFSAGALGIWKAYFFEPILFFILLLNVFKDKSGIIKIFWALLVSALAVSGFAIFQKITGLYIDNPFWAAAATRRAVSFFGYPNAIGLYLGPIIMLLIGWLFSLPCEKWTERIGEKLIISLGIIGSLLAIYAARSEGALIGLAAALLAFGLLAGRKQLIATLIFLAVVIGGLLWSAPTRDFVLTKLTLHDLSGQIRRQQWKETGQMLSDNGRYLTGAGLDNYQAAIKPYHQEGIFFNSDDLPNFDAVVWASSTLQKKYWQPVEIYLYPHNIFLNFWSELGLFGLLLFVWLIAKYLFTAVRLNYNLANPLQPDKYLALGLATAMIAIITHGLVDVPYFKNDLSVMFWLFFALLGILNFRYRRTGENNRLN
ncbi:MAG: O-antigen ligase family protein [Patescibacteria group bacterium]